MVNFLCQPQEFFRSGKRYKHGFFKVAVENILNDPECDLLRGKKYKRVQSGTKKLKDLAEVLPPKKSCDTEDKRKLTTPNSIGGGIRLIDSMSNAQVSEGRGSFIYEVQEKAIIIARITNVRNHVRYLGSAIAGDDYGHLLTREYHQILPKNPSDIYFILCWLRGKEFQEIIVELSKGTTNQRIEVETIMDEPIPTPTDELRRQAKENLLLIEKSLAKIKQTQEDLDQQITSISQMTYF